MKLIFDIIQLGKDLMTPATNVKPPKLFLAVFLVALPASWLPFAAVYWYRSNMERKQPRIHMFLDMDNQPKVKAQSYDISFADGRSNLEPVKGTVARGQLKEDDHYYRGYTIVPADPAEATGDAKQADKLVWSTTYPAQILTEEGRLSQAILDRGKLKFNIYCAACHGESGNGYGSVHVRALQIREPGWIKPKSIYDADVVTQPVGQLYNTVTNGIRNMPSYKDQMSEEDRWATVVYMRALQLSKFAREEDTNK